MKFYKNMSLANKILLLMVVGVVFGFAFKGYYSYWSVVTTPIGDIFLRLLKMTILPLVFFSIISGISSIADMKRLKKIVGSLRAGRHLLGLYPQARHWSFNRGSGKRIFHGRGQHPNQPRPLDSRQHFRIVHGIQPYSGYRFCNVHRRRHYADA